ncbi:MAG TPA: ATP-binding protein [Thermoanaerobaculia bacterium]|jgi:signal transduction histidine kinase/FixJ family two-component response regulator/ligand-binding sensor domain-containing protein
MTKRLPAALVAVLLLSLTLDALAVEQGVPVIRNFTPKEYGAGATNWAVVQDHRGVVYVGNESGVLEYDGVRWRLIATPNGTVVRSLAVDPRGRVYVGAVGEIGYLAPDAQGQYAYVSLLDKVPAAEREFADVWSTWASKDAVYFAAADRLFRIRGNEVRSWAPAKLFALSFLAGDRLFIREPGRGLLELKGDELTPVRGMERFAEDKLYAMFPTDGGMILGTRPHGFFRYDGRALTALGDDEERRLLEQELLYRATALPDGSIAAATVQGGVHLLDRDGRLRLRLTKADGISADSVMALWSEPRGALWLATTAGMSRVEVPSPLSWFDDRRGLPGTIMSMLRHDGALYVGTTLGLFRLTPGVTHDPRFEPVAGMRNQTWSLLSVDGQLLAANNEGVFEIRGLESRLVRASLGASSSMYRSRREPGRVFIGLYGGLASLRREGNGWRDEGVIPGIAAEVRTIEEDAAGRLWIGTWGEGIFRLTFNGAAAPAVEHFTKSEGLPAPNLVNVYRVGEEILFWTEEAMLAFDEKTRRFAADPRFASLFRDGKRRMIPLDGGALAVIAADRERSTNRIAIARPDARGVYALEPATAQDLSVTAVNLVFHEPGVVWFGATEGLFRYDAAVPLRASGGPALIRRVAQGERTLFGGAAVAAQAPELEHSRRSLRFDFGGSGAAAFQYRLEGYEQEWSPWTEETFKEYTNLPGGDYTFRLRTRDARGAVGTEAVYRFAVLSPWYRTPWAWALYLLALAALVWVVVRWRVAHLRKENRLLELRVAERTAQLEAATQAKSVFLANMSHELRTPLNAVLGFSQLMDRSRTLDAEDRGRLAIIRRSGEHLLGLINDVLSISKIEAGKLSLEQKPFDLRELLRAVTAMIRVRAENVGLELVTEIDPDIPAAVSGDAGKLRQVLLNLLGNAVKFTERGRVTLRASWSDGRARFEVEDTGEGMTPEETATLFEAFVQTESGRSAKEGTGLGLVITREIVRLMEGDITVRSTRGAGTTFAFDAALPRTAESVEAMEPKRVVGLATGERRRRILIADDTHENRLLLTSLLGAVGFDTREASNGEEAIALWSAWQPDLILMDMRMPVTDGREAIRRIRMRERETHATPVPVVALTASAFEHERELILAGGADDFLTKPFREATLFEMLERHLAVRFVREEAQPTAQAPADRALLTLARIGTLPPEERRDLYTALLSGSAERAGNVAAKISIRDSGLGRDLLAEIRAFRIDPLLDLLERADS